MPAIQSYRDLRVWQAGREMVKRVYDLSSKLPADEKFGLVSQMRRAATSIPANIAEGWGRQYPAEFVQFLRNANGSLTELETHLILASDLGLVLPGEIDTVLKETAALGKQLLALERSLRRAPQQR